MKMNLLLAQPNGDLAKPIMMLLAVVSFAICIVACYFVSQALPPGARLAHTILGWLQLFAGLGVLQMLVLVVKIFQGGRVQLESKNPGHEQ